MYVDMSCGRCDSSFSIDAEVEDPVWVLLNRFANAHAECGYMTSLQDSEDSPAHKIIMPRLSGDAEEA